MGNSKSSASLTAAAEAGISHLDAGVSVAEASQLWQLYDANQDGYIDTAEMGKLAEHLVQIKLQAYKATLDKVKKVLRDPLVLTTVQSCLDISNDGSISRAEFLVRAIESTNFPIPELQELGVQIGLSQFSTSGKLTADEAGKLWDQYDSNGDGVLDQKECAKLVRDLADGALTGFQQRVSKLEGMLQDPSIVTSMLSSFDVDKDGRVSKAEFMVKAVEGYRLEEEGPPTKRRRLGDEWSMERAFKVSDEEVAAASLRHKVRVIDRDTVDALNAAVDGLNMGILVCPEGFCVVHSATRSSHFVLYVPSAKRSAQSAFGMLESSPPGKWSVQCSFRLCGEGDANKMSVEGKAKLLDSVDSVTLAVEGLQRGLLKCADTVCVVFSSSRKEYYVLYREGSEEDAKARFATN